MFDLSWYLLDNFKTFLFYNQIKSFLVRYFFKWGLLCLLNKYQKFLEVYFLNQNIRAAKYIPVFGSFYASTDVALCSYSILLPLSPIAQREYDKAQDIRRLGKRIRCPKHFVSEKLSYFLWKECRLLSRTGSECV